MINGGEIIGLVAVVAGLAIAIVAIATSAWRRVRLAEIDASLKHKMLDKGLSPDEIEQVLEASSQAAEDGDGEETAYTGNVAGDTAKLAGVLAEHEMSGEDIARVLKAFTDSAGTSDADANRQRAALVESLAEQEMSAEDIERVLRSIPGQPSDTRIRKEEWVPSRP